MKILRYLSRDVLTHMVAVSFVLLVIIFSGRFVKYLAEAAVGEIAGDILLPVMFYRLPGFLELIIPLGLFIGILMSYGRLYVESEMVVLTACGVGPGRMAAYTLAPALLVMLLVASLSLWITPLGAERSEALLDDPASSQGLQTLAAGRFQSRRGSDLVSYTQTIDQDTGLMHAVFLAQRTERDGKPRLEVTVASEGEVVIDGSGARYLELRNGYRYEGLPGQLDYSVVSFDRFGELMRDREGGIRAAAPVDGRPTAQLLGSDSPEDVAALHWRLSLPLMVPIVAVIALCLSRTDHRRGRYVKMAPAIVLYLAYLMLLSNARSQIEDGDALPWLIWAVHGVFMGIGLAMLWGPAAFQRLRQNRLAHA